MSARVHRRVDHGNTHRARIMDVLRLEPELTVEAMMERFHLGHGAAMHYRQEAARRRREDAPACTECGGAFRIRNYTGGRGRLVCSKNCAQKRRNQQEKEKRAGTYKPVPLKHPRRRRPGKRIGVAALAAGYRVVTRYRDSEHATWSEAREAYLLRIEVERAEAA